MVLKEINAKYNPSLYVQPSVNMKTTGGSRMKMRSPVTKKKMNMRILICL